MSTKDKIETPLSADIAFDTVTATPNGEKSTLAQEESIVGSENNSAWTSRAIDPELAAAIAAIPPERRKEIEKRVKRKLDFMMFPVLLIFYVLNYLVSTRPTCG